MQNHNKVTQDKESISFENAYINSTWWSRITMSWAMPIIKYVNKNKTLADPSHSARMPKGVDS